MSFSENISNMKQIQFDFIITIYEQLNKLQDHIDKNGSYSEDLYKKDMNTLKNELTDKNNHISELIIKCTNLEKELSIALDEIQTLKKVSFISNMNKQIHEKDKTIELLNYQLNLYKRKFSVDVSDIQSNISKDEVKDVINEIKETIIEKDEPLLEETKKIQESQESEEDDDIPEIEYDVKKIGKKYYYLSNEDPPGIYAVDKVNGDSEVGNKLGHLDNKGKPVFY